jgi:hypothetical protein
MSLDIFKQSVEPSRFRHGEGYQDWTLANPARAGEAAMTNRSSQHHGGVGGHGMPVMFQDVRNEISADGRQRPTAGASGHTARPVRSGGEVGAVHSSDEGRNEAGAKGPHLVEDRLRAPVRG